MLHLLLLQNFLLVTHELCKSSFILLLCRAKLLEVSIEPGREGGIEDIIIQGVNRLRSPGVDVWLQSSRHTSHRRVFHNHLRPRVELVEQGPRLSFVATERRRLASDELFKAACKQPRELKTKMRKNTEEDVFGSKLGRVHVGQQNVDAIQTRKMKALRGARNMKKGAKEAATAAAAEQVDEAMEE